MLKPFTLWDIIVGDFPRKEYAILKLGLKKKRGEKQGGGLQEK